MLRSFIQLYRASLSGLAPNIWLLALVTLINRAGTMVIPFMTVYLTTELHFSGAETGYIMAFFGAGSVAGSFLGGKLTDGIGYFRTMIGSFFFGGIMFFVLMQQQTFWEIAITIFMLSMINDIFRPALFSAVAIFSPPEDRTRSVSLIRLAINLGYATGPAFAGVMAMNLGFEWLFVVDGTTCILAAFFVWLTIPKELKARGDDEISAALPASIFRDPVYLVFLLLTTLISIIFMQIFFTIPVFFKTALFFEEDTVGYLMALNGLLIVFIEMPLVHFSESRKTNLHWVIIGTLLIAASFLVLSMAGPGRLVFALPILHILLITVGEIYMFPFTNSFAFSRTNDRNRGSYMGYYSMAFSVSLIIAPITGFQIVEAYGYNVLWYSLAAAGLIVVAGFLGLKGMLEKY